MKSLRLGFVGAGEMAMWSVYPSLHFAPIRLEAVCDLDVNKVEIAAEKFGVQSSYTDCRGKYDAVRLGQSGIIQMTSDK